MLSSAARISLWALPQPHRGRSLRHCPVCCRGASKGRESDPAARRPSISQQAAWHCLGTPPYDRRATHRQPVARLPLLLASQHAPPYSLGRLQRIGLIPGAELQNCYASSVAHLPPSPLPLRSHVGSPDARSVPGSLAARRASPTTSTDGASPSGRSIWMLRDAASW